MVKNISIKKENFRIMSNFLLKYKEFILLTIIVILLVLNIMNSRAIRTDVKQYQKRFDYIQSEINSLKKKNEAIDTKLSENYQKINVVDSKIEVVDKNIKIVKKNTDEKVGNVDTFKPNELELFFTNRYK